MLSAIGFAILALTDAEMAANLTRIQNDLFDLGADLGGDDRITDGRKLRADLQGRRSRRGRGGGIGGGAHSMLNNGAMRKGKQWLGKKPK